jgi:hypothetical protein
MLCLLTFATLSWVVPYLFDRKVVFYREEKKYHLLKDGIEYIVRAHHIKTNVSLVSTGK